MYAKILMPASTRKIVSIRAVSFFGTVSSPVSELETTER
jgi:hypothetical protein